MAHVNFQHGSWSFLSAYNNWWECLLSGPHTAGNQEAVVANSVFCIAEPDHELEHLWHFL